MQPGFGLVVYQVLDRTYLGFGTWFDKTQTGLFDFDGRELLIWEDLWVL